MPINLNLCKDSKNKKPINDSQDKGYDNCLINMYKFLCGVPLEETPLFKAVRLGDYKLMHLLLESGVDVTIRDKSGDTILHKLASKHLSFVDEWSFEDCIWQKELISKCAKEGSLDKKSGGGGTALTIALDHHNDFLVECLLNEGAQITIVDALSIVGRITAPLMLEIFVENCAEQGIINEWFYGENLLKKAISYKDFELATLLIKHGANVEDESGESIMFNSFDYSDGSL